ncbi:MAG: imidazole glycerol phosphate synthase subunit HisH [Candidatus Hydrogenedentes bacterium]|nr:imidazole glycerol phosphate synthase subunit HisH [Candidatus Hydrogenedentota bacterium]
MSTVAIIDYGMGNLDSVARAVEECGAHPMVAERASALAEADRIILPGVGAFGDGMRELAARSFDQALRDEVLGNGIPLLGICLGMQLLADTGFEGGETPGLGFIAGEVVRLEPDTPGTRIPHVGWNEVEASRPCALFEGVASGTDFYFVHSYHFRCADSADAAACTPYCGGFVSCVHRGPVFGVQFHPEKSQKPGLRLLSNFLAL